MGSRVLTSPYDQDLIISGDVKAMRIESKFSTCAWGLKNLRRSFIRSPFLLELDVDAEGADFLDQHVEGLRHPGVHRVVAVYDVLVHLGAAVHGRSEEHTSELA